ncbi:MAG: histone deacetylase family protein [Candidatus Thorarchaeota archaeon]
METFDFGRSHPVRIGRFQMVRDFIESSGFLKEANVEIVSPKPLNQRLLTRIHSQEYIKKIKEISKTGKGDVDIDTPGFKGIFPNAVITCGATVTGVESILKGRINHFLSPTGGFHHSSFNRGGGFCIFNDIAAATYRLLDAGFKRILIADFDVHHGNGTQTYFNEDPRVMMISFHEDPEWLYPHEGYIRENGRGAGKGFTINMPFPLDSGDAVYKFAFDRLVPPLLEFHKPDFILFLPGFDAHYRDPLAHLNLTAEMIRYVADYIHRAAHRWSNGRLGIVSGGGYHPEAFRWCIGEVMSAITGHPYSAPKQEPPFDDDEETWDIVRKNVEEIEESAFRILGIDSKTESLQCY